MELNDRAMKALLDAFDRSDWQEMTISVGSDTLHVSRQASGDGVPASAAAPAMASAPEAPPLPAAAGPDAPAAPPAPAATEAAPPAPAASAAPASGGTATAGTGTVVESPSVGLFWRAPSPTSPPFVETGGRVEAGDTVAIVEVMKLMNHVVAPLAGVVTSILVENGAAVEYGDALMTIDPEG